MQPTKMNRIRTTNPLAEIISGDRAIEQDLDAIDAISRLREWDCESYEEREKDIPELIYEVLKRESRPSSKLVRRSYMEEDAWLVRVHCREGEHLSDHGHEVLSRDRKGEIVPALIEGESVAMHLIKIHVPRIFIRTLSLPMISGEH